MPLQPEKVTRTTTYVWAILVLIALVLASAIGFAIIGLDANSTPLAVSVVGMVGTVVTTLLVLVRVEAVATQTDGHLTELTQANRKLHERLTVEAERNGPRD